MKATIEIDGELYRQVKAAAAIRGRKVKDLVAEGLRTVLRSPHVSRSLQFAEAYQELPNHWRRWMRTSSTRAIDATESGDLSHFPSRSGPGSLTGRKSMLASRQPVFRAAP